MAGCRSGFSPDRRWCKVVSALTYTIARDSLVPLNVRAAVVHGPNQPFVVEEVQLEGPRAGEVLVQVKTTGLCHSDLHAYEGKVPWQFPAILGHEAAGVIVECGPGVTQFKVGDHVIPFLIPQCGVCVLPFDEDELVRRSFRACGRGEPLLARRQASHATVGTGHVRGVHGAAVDTIAKVRDDAPFDPICYIGCGATTGLGAALFAAKVERGSSVIVFGLGGIGLNVVQARLAGAKTIIGVDTNPDKEAIARRFGATEFVDPRKVEKLTSHLMKLTGGGADYTFECIGSPQVMRQAFECTNPRGARATSIGVAPHGAEVSAPRAA